MPGTARPRPLTPGATMHERNACALLEQAQLLPEAVVAQMIAVVAREDDYGVVAPGLGGRARRLPARPLGVDE